MAEFSKLIITEKGEELIAKAVANTAVIKFTKISSSNKTYEFSELKTLETLVGIKQTFTDPRVKRANGASVKINAAFHNVELTEGYYLRTIGLYAEDPDAGEILYGVASEMSGNCYIPAYNGVTSSGVYIKLVTKVGDAGNVSVELDPAAVATIGDVEALRESLEVVDFDDSGEVEGIGSFSDFMSSFVKGTSIYKLLENLKAGLKYVLHAGQLVNNGLCETPGQFPLDAAYGKELTDRITGLYSEIADIKLLSPSYISKTVSRTNLEIKNNKATFVLNKDTVISAIATVTSNTGNVPTVIIAGAQGSSYPVSDPNGGVISFIPYLALKAGTYAVNTSGTRLISVSIGFME